FNSNSIGESTKKSIFLASMNNVRAFSNVEIYPEAAKLWINSKYIDHNKILMIYDEDILKTFEENLEAAKILVNGGLSTLLIKYLTTTNAFESIKDHNLESKFVLYNNNIPQDEKYNVLQNKNRLKDIFKEKFPGLSEEEIENIIGNIDRFAKLHELGLINKLTTEDFKKDPKELLNEKHPELAEANQIIFDTLNSPKGSLTDISLKAVAKFANQQHHS
ncbi:hypothetical protein, partial [Wolbachia endosymbiont of Pentidionis agamae]|uniref:hypothetical protein n=1 Tax=Wolbachia endosymbiont of Pentidionis agamae TaxID=3110435 RepID=UPI002FD101AD